MDTLWTTVFLCIATLVGAVTQRMTGIGFSLVAAPFYVLLLGPVEGVALGNVTAIVFALAMTVLVIRSVDWKLFAMLSVAAIAGAVPGAIVVLVLPPDALRVGIGIAVVAGMAVSVVAARTSFSAPPWLRYPAGFVSGFMGTSAGVGGPAITVYAVSARIDHTVFAATAQPYFTVAAATAITMKTAFGGNVVPDFPAPTWLSVAAAGAAGLVIGSHFASRVPPHISRRVMIVLAIGGGLLTVAQGVAGILTNG